MARRFLLGVLAALALSLGSADAAEKWETLPPTPAPVADIKANRADVNGIKLYYAEIGSGAPVVFLHGGLANSDYFGNQVAALAKSYRVILVDSRGHGRSARDQ